MQECDRLIESNHFLEEANKIPVFPGDESEAKVLNLKRNLLIKKSY